MKPPRLLLTANTSLKTFHATFVSRTCHLIICVSLEDDAPLKSVRIYFRKEIMTTARFENSHLHATFNAEQSLPKPRNKTVFTCVLDETHSSALLFFHSIHSAKTAKKCYK